MEPELFNLNLVPPTFSATSHADCILRSSDELDFYVLRGILIFASDMFKDMFSLPPSGPNADLPIINVAENGRTLSTLLSIIYPIVPPEITDINLAVDLAQAWQKYLMPPERLRPFLGRVFNQMSLLQRPLDVYALAWRLGDKVEATRASRWTHGHPLSFEGMTRIISLSGDQAALDALVKLREDRQPKIRMVARLVPIREHACPNHGGGDNGTYDKNAYIEHAIAVEERSQSILDLPDPAVCTDFRSFLGFQVEGARWPKTKLAKKCSHPTDNYCFGSMDQWQISETSEAIEKIRESLPDEVEWPESR